MKVFRSSGYAFVLAGAFLFLAQHATAQQSGSSASVSQSRAIINNQNPQTVYPRPANPNGFSVTMDDMNNGLTQVVMARFRAKNSLKAASAVKVRLSYFDVQRKRAVEETQEVKLVPGDNKFSDLLADTEVKKNYTIAELAQSLFEMTEAARRQNCRQAERLLNASAEETYRRFPNMEGKDVRFILNIVEGYRRDLKTVNRPRPADDCGKCN